MIAALPYHAVLPVLACHPGPLAHPLHAQVASHLGEAPALLVHLQQAPGKQDRHNHQQEGQEQDLPPGDPTHRGQGRFVIYFMLFIG